VRRRAAAALLLLFLMLLLARRLNQEAARAESTSTRAQSHSIHRASNCGKEGAITAAFAPQQRGTKKNEPAVSNPNPSRDLRCWGIGRWERRLDASSAVWK